MSIYESIYYGAGNNFYGPSDTDVPTDLRFYRTNVDNVYVFHWGFQESFITPTLSTLDFDLQLDTDPSFTSPNLVTFDSTTAITFQNGDVRKGFAVPVATRLDNETQTWYARVRSKSGFTTSAWSLILVWEILRRWELQESEALLNNLPDYHVYNKEDLLKAVQDRKTKLYTVCNMYGREFDQNYLEDTLTATNNYVDLCRDEQLFDNFGTFFDFPRPQTEAFVQYRLNLENLILASLIGGTLDAVIRVIRSFTGVAPLIQLIRDRNDFFLTTQLETPTPAPDGATTNFIVSSDYVIGSLVVLKNGLVLSPGTDYTENHSLPGFTMSVAPTLGSTLQVFFDVGSAGSPDPVIFDLSDRTALSGTVTFTNNSLSVTGVGTAFQTELQVGRVITDSAGMVLGTVNQIVSNTSLNLEDPWIGSTGAGTAYKINFNGTTHISGTVSFVSGSPAVSGSGTNFTTELSPGDTITDDAGSVTGVIQTISTDVALTLTSNWTGSTASNTNARKLIYSEPILWDKHSLAYGFIIVVRNPGLFDLDRSLIEKLVIPLLPAHCKVFFDFQ